MRTNKEPELSLEQNALLTSVKVVATGIILASLASEAIRANSDNIKTQIKDILKKI